MKKKKRTDPEWLKFRAESLEHERQVRERLAREEAELARLEAEKKAAES